MKLNVATSSLVAVLVTAATAALSMTAGASASAAATTTSYSSSAVSATATALSHRATAAKRSLLNINDPNDHELHATSADDPAADEVNARTSGDDDATTAARTGRRLAYSGPTADVLSDFAPLPCNAALACDAETIALSAAMASPEADGSVRLGCGKCYRVDQTGDVSIPGGLNIEGRLTVPTNAKVTITTPFIFVQGELIARDDQVVAADTTSLQIILTGQTERTLQPHEANAAKCPPGGCPVGNKAIVVAGGKLSIDGYAANGGECPTWLHLTDIDAPSPDTSTLVTPADSYYLTPAESATTIARRAQARARQEEEEVEVDAAGAASTSSTGQRRLEHCPAILIDEHFDTADCTGPCQLNTRLPDGFHGWKGGWGSTASLTSDGALRISNRTIATGSMVQGPEYDLGHYKSCLLEGEKYLFSAKVRLYKEDGTSSLCGSRDPSLGVTWEHCPHLRAWAANDRGHDRSRSDKAWISPEAAKPDGEWMHLEKSIDFNELYSYSETPETALYELLKIRVKEEDVVMEIDDVYFGKPPTKGGVSPTNGEPSTRVDVFPDLTDPAVCDDLVVGDGTAESARFAFPFYSNDRWRGRSLTIEEEVSRVDNSTTNKFYRLGYRESHGSSLNFQMIPGCITHGSLYTFSGKFRLNQPGVVKDPYIEILAKKEGQSEKWIWLTDKGDFSLGGHSGDVNGWTKVEFGVTFTEEFASYDSYEFWLRTYGNEAHYNDLARRHLYPELDFDDLSFTRNHGPIRGLVVPNTIDGCWGDNTDVLVTSHTTANKDQQVRTITAIESPDGPDGNRVLVLDRSILNAPSLATDPDTAVEVALLNRNIRFDVDAVDQGQYNGNQRSDMPQGGHLVVMNTPTVVQQLSGVQFSRFGQMGKAWRHPINFMMSRSVAGSVVSNNVIREAYHKCIVVQGTDDLHIKGNVAYDTKGHCFVLQDGAETGNTFEGNLGALTKEIKRDYRSPSSDTGNDPATFLISNPRNSFIGNVAAGSDEEGFWFELRRWSVRGLSKERMAAEGISNGYMMLQRAPITLFKDNVAHSNGVVSLRFRDYFPTDGEQVVQGFKSYRNAYGVWMYYAADIAFEGLYAADNYEKNFDINRADNIRVQDATIIGYSDFYRKQVASQDLWHHCHDRDGALVGIEFNYFQESVTRYKPGTRVENVRFSGFADTGCSKSAAMAVDERERRGIGNTWNEFTQLKSITVVDNSPLYDGQSAQIALVDDVVMNDLDGSLDSAPDNASSFGVLVTNKEYMTKLANGTCTEYPDLHYSYCANTCLRTVHYLTNIFETEDIKLRAIDNNDPSRFVDFDGNMQMDWGWYKQEDGSWKQELNQWNNNHDYKNRVFSASLPSPLPKPDDDGYTPGYTLKFVDVNGNQVWPSYARKIIEPAPDAECPTWSDDAVTIDVPPLTNGDCHDLIRNGDVDTYGNFTHWMHTSGGAFHAEGAGIDNSSAVASISRWSHWQQISQYLDSRCVKAAVGRELEFKAWFRLEQKINNVWVPYTCDPDSRDYEKGCPLVRMYMKKYDSNQADQDSRLERDFTNMIGAVRPMSPEGEYSMIHGTMMFDEQMGDYDTFFLSIGRTKHNSRVYIDNISLKPLQPESLSSLPYTIGRASVGLASRSASDASGATESQPIIMNGNFEEYDTTMYWVGRDRHAALELVQVNGLNGEPTTALKVFDRHYQWYGPAQYVNPHDFVSGQEYEVSFQYKLTDSDGNSVICDPSNNGWGYERCPVARFYADARPNGGGVSYPHIGSTVSPGTSENPWGVVHGVFTPGSNVINAYKVYFYAEYPHPDLDMTIDNVAITPYKFVCTDNIIQNGDFEQGHFAFWEKAGDHRTSLSITKGYGTDSNALKVSGRHYYDWGVYQYIHDSCLSAGHMFKVTAKLKMTKEGAEPWWECNIESTDRKYYCPSITAKDHGVVASVVGKSGMSDDNEWDGWYDVSGTFEMYKRDVVNDFYLKIERAPIGVDLIIDNIIVSEILK